jgi:hypothetical protein
MDGGRKRRVDGREDQSSARESMKATEADKVKWREHRRAMHELRDAINSARLARLKARKLRTNNSR